jgi:hypothetical protein
MFGDECTSKPNNWASCASKVLERRHGAQLDSTGLDLTLPGAHALWDIDDPLLDCDQFTIEFFVHVPDASSPPSRSAKAATDRSLPQLSRAGIPVDLGRPLPFETQVETIEEAEFEDAEEASPVVAPRRKPKSQPDALWHWPVLSTLSHCSGWEIQLNQHGDVGFCIAHEPIDGKLASTDARAPQTSRSVYGPWTYRALTYDKGRVTTYFPCTVHYSTPRTVSANNPVSGCLTINAPAKKQVVVNREASASMVTATPPVWSPSSTGSMGSPAAHMPTTARGAYESSILCSPESESSTSTPYATTPTGMGRFSPATRRWVPGAMSLKMFGQSIERALSMHGAGKEEDDGELERASVESCDTAASNMGSARTSPVSTTTSGADESAPHASQQSDEAIATATCNRINEDYAVSLYATSKVLWPTYHASCGWRTSGNRVSIGANTNFHEETASLRHAPIIVGAIRVSRGVLHPQQFMDVALRSNGDARRAFIQVAQQSFQQESG